MKIKDFKIKFSHVVVALFLLLIYLPAILFASGKVFHKKFDIQLGGYTDKIERPPLSTSTLLDGSFQQSFSPWIESKLPLRGVCVTAYNTLNYNAFSLGSRGCLIGKDGFVFEPNYLNHEVSIGEWDITNPQCVSNVQNLTDHLESVNNKLAPFGKHLYVYVTPSKANIYHDYMPSSYLAIDDGGPRVVDIFREMIEQTNVPHRFFADYANQMEYPTFYSTGIHWSRTYEQYASNIVLSDLREITGNDYRNLSFVGVNSSNEPFWRDSDLFDMLNVWSNPDITYYQYEVEADREEVGAPLRMLISGDSFAIGLIRDVNSCLPEDQIFYVNRDDYMQEPGGNMMVLGDDLNNLDFQYLLDVNDVIVIELLEVEIVRGTYGFIDYLDAYLDTYVPQDSYSYYLDNFDAFSTSSLRFCNGYYNIEDGFVWLKPSSYISLLNPSIRTDGLDFEYSVPNEVFLNSGEDVVRIFVNDVLVSEETYTTSATGSIHIDASELEALGCINDSDIYSVQIECSSSFIPCEIGMGDDSRDLAIRLVYLGGAR